MRLTTGIGSLDIICAALSCLLIFRLVKLTRRIPKGLRLPPGPPGRPIIGNIPDLPKEGSPLWKTIHGWVKEYGDIIHVNLLGQSIIIVSSLDIAQDLLEKRSAIYSDRMDMPMAIDLSGWGWNFGFMRYGEWWRRHRKMFHQHFRPEAVTAYHNIHERQTQVFLRRLYESPDDFMYHIRHLSGAVIMEVVYGIKVLPRGDPYIEVAETGMRGATEASAPGKWIVDFWPFLKSVPEWMPGAGFRQKAREWRVPITGMVEIPFRDTKAAINAGTAGPSIAATLLDELSSQDNPPPDEETVIRNVTGVSFVGGADTMISTLATFVLLMVLNPDVQRRAQAEIDSVVGDRLPVVEDCKNLPYVEAVYKELHRWHPPLPLGVGHRAMEDDVYGEYFIPAGSIILPNAWSILRNEKTYGADPETFNPERFLKPGIVNPSAQYGFGRRVCPGRYMADDFVFIAMASMLRVFDMSPARDDNGKEIPPKPTYSTGLLSRPEVFPCTIKPRSDSTRDLMLNTAYA